MSTEPNSETAGKMIVFGAKRIRRDWVDEQRRTKQILDRHEAAGRDRQRDSVIYTL